MFNKPSTAKGVIKRFGLSGLEYRPRRCRAFHQRYRELILAMKAAIDPSLAPGNAACCGFAMMSLKAKPS